MSPLRHAAIALLAIVAARSAAAPAAASRRHTALRPRLRHPRGEQELRPDPVGGERAPTSPAWPRPTASPPASMARPIPAKATMSPCSAAATTASTTTTPGGARPGPSSAECPHANLPDYPNHTVTTDHLGDQLQAAGLTWKAYLESLPEPGSLAYVAPDARVTPSATQPVYAAKHSGFPNFRSAQQDPDRKRHLVGFDQLQADLASGELPNFALVVPNQCNEMHGLFGADAPPDCQITNTAPADRSRRQGGRQAGSRDPEDAPPGRARTTSPSSSPSTKACRRTARGCCGSPARRGGRAHPHPRHHQSRSARGERRHALQSLLSAAHAGERVRPHRPSRARGRRRRGREADDAPLPRALKAWSRRATCSARCSTPPWPLSILVSTSVPLSLSRREAGWWWWARARPARRWPLWRPSATARPSPAWSWFHRVMG